MEVLSKAEFCRCCLLNTADTENELTLMSKSFTYQNKPIKLYDAYFETTGCPADQFTQVPLTDNNICQFCVNELENAFVFRMLCLEANDILKRKFEESKKAAEENNSPPSKGSKRKENVLPAKDVLLQESTKITEIITPINRRSGKRKTKFVIPPVMAAEEINFNVKVTRKRKSKDPQLPESIEEVRGQVPEAAVTTPETPTGSRKSTRQKTPTSRSSDKSDADQPTTPSPSDMSSNNEKSFETPESDKNLITSKILDIGDGQFQCIICEKTTASKQYIYRHIRGHFTPVQKSDTPGEFACKECDRIFTCRSGLSKHYNKEHLNVRQKCDVCNKVFKSRSGLHSHTKSNHLNMRFECLICSQEFKAINALKEHNRIQHQNVRYDCKLCGKSCRKLEDLWVHSFKHRGFLPFACKQCEYQTAVKSNYKIHLRKQHTIVFSEKLHGYNRETREDVLNFVRDKKTASPTID